MSEYPRAEQGRRIAAVSDDPQVPALLWRRTFGGHEQPMGMVQATWEAAKTHFEPRRGSGVVVRPDAQDRIVRRQGPYPGFNLTLIGPTERRKVPEALFEDGGYQLGENRHHAKVMWPGHVDVVIGLPVTPDHPQHTQAYFWANQRTRTLDEKWATPWTDPVNRQPGAFAYNALRYITALSGTIAYNCLREQLDNLTDAERRDPDVPLTPYAVNQQCMSYASMISNGVFDSLRYEPPIADAAPESIAA